MEKINITKMLKKEREGNRDSKYLLWAFCEALGHMPQKKDLDGFTNEDGDKVFNVHLSINGVEVKFSEIILKIFKNCDESVKDEAQIIFAEKLEDIFSPLEELKEKIQDYAEEKLGIKIDSEDD